MHPWSLFIQFKAFFFPCVKSDKLFFDFTSCLNFLDLVKTFTWLWAFFFFFQQTFEALGMLEEKAYSFFYSLLFEDMNQMTVFSVKILRN